MATIGAFLHCFALCYLGLQSVLGCREADAAGFVAAACMFTGIASSVLGALCSAAGVI